MHRFTQDTLKILERYAQDTLKKGPRYAQDSPDTPKTHPMYIHLQFIMFLFTSAQKWVKMKSLVLTCLLWREGLKVSLGTFLSLCCC